jgi:hypothetical protein
MKTVKACMAATLMSAATAFASTWSFEIRNIQAEPNPMNIGFEQILGSFTAQDLDHDGVIQRSEVSAFDVWGFQILPTVTVSDPLGDVSSSLDSFSFDGSALSFRARGVEVGRAFFSIETGVGVDLISGLAGGATGHWTPETTMTVHEVRPPVPEPQTLTMLAAGLTLLPWLAGKRRKSRASAPGGLAPSA